jgi:hypothetical protein
MALCHHTEGDSWCISGAGHRGRHAMRPMPAEEAEPVMETVDVAVIEPERVEGEEPAVGWTPDADDFVSLKGKAYLPARRRIQWMRGIPEPQPDWTIDTEVVEHERGKLIKPGPVGVGRVGEGYALIRANIFDGDGRLVATGLKSEYSENFTDYLEKAETGAIARALAVAGFGTESALDLDEGVDAGRIADAPVEVPAAKVKLGPSAVGGVGRGGKTESASVAQIRRVADLSKQLGLGPSGLSVLIDKLFTVPIGRLPSGEAEASIAVATYLANQSGSDVGKLIDTLESSG